MLAWYIGNVCWIWYTANVACRYGISPLVFNSRSNMFAAWYIELNTPREIPYQLKILLVCCMIYWVEHLKRNSISVYVHVIYRFSQAWKRSSHFFFPHVSRAQRLAPGKTRTRVVRLGAQCTDHWTTGQRRGVGVPAVQLATHVKSSTLYGRMVVRSYGRTSKFFRLDGLLLFYIIMGLRSVSSAIFLHISVDFFSLLCFLPWGIYP